MSTYRSRVRDFHPDTIVSGRDYRADTAEFVLHGFGFPEVSDDQLEALQETLIARELDRGHRIKEGAPGDQSAQIQ